AASSPSSAPGSVDPICWGRPATPGAEHRRSRRSRPRSARLRCEAQAVTHPTPARGDDRHGRARCGLPLPGRRWQNDPSCAPRDPLPQGRSLEAVGQFRGDGSRRQRPSTPARGRPHAGSTVLGGRPTAGSPTNDAVRPEAEGRRENMQKLDELDKASLREDVPAFRAGDNVKVHVKVIEGNRSRIQIFQGYVIGRQGHGVGETFRVRKISFGVGVERVFPVHAPTVDKIEVVTRGDVRRAKLYYLRNLTGKKARIREKREHS